MDIFEGHTTKVFPKTLLKSLIHVVNIYLQSVGETPNLSAKSSFNNPSLKRINVSKNSPCRLSFLEVLHLRCKTLLNFFACFDPFQ